MTLKITECYAILVNCFWNWADWTDRTAKIFDTCALSKDTEISLYEYKNDFPPYYFYGSTDTVAISGLFCNPGYNEIIPLWRPTIVYGQTLLANLMAYIDIVTPEEGFGDSLYQSI